MQRDLQIMTRRQNKYSVLVSNKNSQGNERMGNRKESTGNVTILVVVEGTCDTLQTGGPHDISVIFV